MKKVKQNQGIGKKDFPDKLIGFFLILFNCIHTDMEDFADFLPFFSSRHKNMASFGPFVR